MSDQLYIHYGNTIFDPSKSFPIRNRELFVKPKGGLWGSRVNATFGWKDWCREEDFRDCDPSNAFIFTIKDNYKIYTISTIDQLEDLPYIKNFNYCIDFEYCINFEQCLRLGIDAIELCWYGDEYKDIRKGNLHYVLYGWDCDSIVVLNPDAVLVHNLATFTPLLIETRNN